MKILDISIEFEHHTVGTCSFLLQTVIWFKICSPHYLLTKETDEATLVRDHVKQEVKRYKEYPATTIVCLLASHA